MKFEWGLRKWLLVALIVSGSWQFIHAAYMYGKAALSQRLILSAWVESMAEQKQIKPWSWADTWPAARLIVPKYGVDLIVLEGDSGHALAFGPGYRLGSAQPGEKGNTVISAHRDTHFKFLQYLVENDEIYLQIKNGKMHRYVVQGSKVVDEQTPVYSDESIFQLTLVTCFPFDALLPGGSLRYIVTAEKVNENRLRT